MVAKISDLGNARLVNLRPGQLAQTLTRIPGTLAYMPPEALSETSTYGPKLDIFSFGHLALFTLIQVSVVDMCLALWLTLYKLCMIFLVHSDLCNCELVMLVTSTLICTREIP